MSKNVITAADMTTIADDAVTVGIEELKEQYIDTMNLSVEVEKVRAKAYEFCEAYEKYESVFTTVNKKTQKSRISEQKLLETGVRQKFLEFQNIVNEYFKQVMLVMYVYMDPNQGGKVTLAITENNIDHLRTARGGVEYHLEQIQTIFRDESYDSKLLDITEQSIYARWQVARSKHKSKNFLPILWHIAGTKWGGVKVNNLGTIAEAYVNFYLAKYLGFTGRLESDVEQYLTNSTYGAASVDNASGFLIGDTQIGGISAGNNQTASIQFAVKKDSASPMRIKRVYSEVSALLKDEIFQIDRLKDKFYIEEKRKAQQNQVQQLLGSSLADSTNKIIGEYKEKIDIGIY